MAASAPFDTVDYARKLEAAGVPSAQAELQARALNDALASSVATRADLTNLRTDIDARFAGLDARLDAKFETVDLRFVSLESRVDAKIDSVAMKLGGKIETLQWMFGVLVAMNAAVVIQLFLKH